MLAKPVVSMGVVSAYADMHTTRHRTIQVFPYMYTYRKEGTLENNNLTNKLFNSSMSLPETMASVAMRCLITQEMG
eukprot:1866934-Rhodomonas_salina.2